MDLKRLFDIVLSALSMLVFAIPVAIIYLCVRLEDGGPAIYSQERIGYKGRPFMLYKFRSMVPHAEHDDNPHLCEQNDDRLTRVGRFLRDHHLDEFPQLWNIFIGDMSFVGPRPERKFFIDQIMQHDPRYTELYAVRPGIFSMATLYNGYTDTIEKMLRRLEMDLDYVAHRSLWLDLKIIWLTTVSILSGKKF
ncbi:MAG: sugar transferase [Prevotella sp.]|nr:sugar transferase [Prevotella sp.]